MIVEGMNIWTFAERNKSDVVCYNDAMHNYMLRHEGVLSDESTVRGILTRLSLSKMVFSFEELSGEETCYPEYLCVTGFDGKWVSVLWRTACAEDIVRDCEMKISIPDAEIIGRVVGEHKEYFKTSIDKEFFFLLFCIFLMFNKLLTDKTSSFDVEEKIVHNRNAAKKPKGRKKRNVVRRYRCYTLKRETLPKLSGAKRKISCPCWSVRGHYRHYASGKTVFIRQYIKGENRATGEVTSKKYKIFQEANTCEKKDG